MTTRSKITLRNAFHNTEATVIAFDNIISARAMRRAENKLCGISDCQCGGTRGQQDVYLVCRSDGSVETYPLETLLSTDMKYEMFEIAGQLAQKEHGKEFYELSKELQRSIWLRAEEAWIKGRME